MQHVVSNQQNIDGGNVLLEKVKVSRKVADEIEEVLKANTGNKNDALKRHAEGWQHGSPIQHFSLINFARALIVGYEVEKTPQEQLEEFYRLLPYEEQKETVIAALDILKIKVSGVNNR